MARFPSAVDVDAWVRAIRYHDKWKSGRLGYSLAGGALNSMLKDYSRACEKLSKYGLGRDGKPLTGQSKPSKKARR